MGSLGFTLASLVVMVAILSIFGAVRKEQEPQPKASLASVPRSNRDTHQLTQLQQANSTLETSLLTAQEKIADLEQQIESLSQVRVQLEEQVQSQAAEQTLAQDLNQQLAILSQDKSELQLALEQAESAQHQLQTQIQALSQEQATLAESLRTAQAEVNALEEKLSYQGDAEIELQQAQEELSTLAQTVEQLTQEKDSLSQALQQSQLDLSARTLEVESLQQQLSDQAQEKSALQDAMQRSQAAVDSLQKQLEELSQAHQQLEELSQAHQELSQAHQELASSTLEAQSAVDDDSEPSDPGSDGAASSDLTFEPEPSEPVESDVDQSDLGQAELDSLESENAKAEMLEAGEEEQDSLEPASNSFTSEDIALVKSLGLETATTEDVDPGEPSGLEEDRGFTRITRQQGFAISGSIDLAGKSIVMTGTLNHLSPNEFRERVQAVGGRVQSNPNSRTDYIVVGENPGSKLQKAERHGVVPISEAQLLEILNNAPEVATEESSTAEA